MALEATVAEVEVALAAAVHTHRLLHRTATLIAEETGVWSDEVGQRVSRRTLPAGTMYEPLGLSPFCKSSKSHHSRIRQPVARKLPSAVWRGERTAL